MGLKGGKWVVSDWQMVVVWDRPVVVRDRWLPCWSQLGFLKLVQRKM
jgi:hypothetical protein